jgi:hypothetical protein
MDKSETIINIWKSNGYVGASKLKKILANYSINETLKNISEIIKKQRVNQIHKTERKNKKALGHIITYAKDNKWQIDIADMANYASSNKGYKYILLAIDVFTRKAHAQPMKNKAEKSVTEAFNKMIMNEQPLMIMSDNDSAFNSKEFRDNAIDNDISQAMVTVGDHHALGLIDRLTRTLKEMTHKHFTDNNSTNWIDHLQHYINAYNNNPHSGVKDLSPNSVTEPDNEKIILHENIKKALNTMLIKPDIYVGDTVKIKISGLFKKGYAPNYTEENYKVVRVTKVSAILDNGTRHKFSDLKKVDDSDRDVLPFSNPQKNIIHVEKKNAKAKRDFNKSGLDKADIVEGKRTRKQPKNKIGIVE